MKQKSKLFLYFTYDSEDVKFVGLVVNVLNSLGIFDVFLSPHDAQGVIPKLDSVKETRIEKCDLLVALFTRMSLRSTLVKKEIDLAERKKKMVIPLMDTSVRLRHISELTGYFQIIPFSKKDASAIVKSILERIRYMQPVIGISQELIEKAFFDLEQSTSSRRTFWIKRAEKLSRIIAFRGIIAETFEELGYSVEKKESLRYADRIFDMKIAGKGREIWIKCLMGSVTTKDLSRRLKRIPEKDEIWFVLLPAGPKTHVTLEEAVAEYGNIHVIPARALVNELDGTVKKQLIERLELLFLDVLLEVNASEAQLLELTKMPEGQRIEFKSTLRFNTRKKGVESSLEKACLKTICAFLNAEGGTLMIGIGDDRQLIGLSHDYQTLKNQNKDGFENHLVNLISSRIGNEFLSFVKISFVESQNKEVCEVKVSPSNIPAFLKEGDAEEFYVRTGNNSRPFSISEAIEYTKHHWKQHIS